MRALCGAIITAGALIGLGLWSIGAGTRYAAAHNFDANTGEPQWVHVKTLDAPLLITLVALLCLTAIGLGIALLGLAYHHHRRHHEMLHRQKMAAASPPRPPNPPSERVTV
jgi:hypothetical protein